METLMEGVQVLSKAQMTEPTGLTLIAGILFALTCMGFIELAIMSFLEHKKRVVLRCLFMILILGIGSGLCINRYTRRITYYEYKVTISDTALLSEFNKKFEIRSQEGLIYTVVERKIEKEERHNEN